MNEMKRFDGMEKVEKLNLTLNFENQSLKQIDSHMVSEIFIGLALGLVLSSIVLFLEFLSEKF